MTTKPKKHKPKKATVSQLFVDKILADVQRARKEKGVAPEVAKAEAELDAEAGKIFAQTNGIDHSTKLDAATALGRIERDGGPVFDLIGTWRPAMAVAPEDLLPLAGDIRAAKERVESTRLAKMTDAERELHALEQQQAKLLADEKANAEHAKRLADPKVKTTLEKLRALDDRTAKDESWDYAETVAIARAIFAVETQGSDLAAALQLADEAFGIDKQKKLDAMTAHESEVARLCAEIDALADKPAEKIADPPAETNPADDSAPVPSASTWDAWQKLKADPSASYAAVQAASKAWYESLKSATPAETSPAEGDAL